MRIESSCFHKTLIVTAASLVVLLAATVDLRAGPNDQRCGNGIREHPEECDNGVQNSDSRPDACRTDCILPRCGDGVQDRGEQCDEGRSNSDLVPDECRLDCRAAHCGDGVRDRGEACDEDSPWCTRCQLCVDPKDGMVIDQDTTLCEGSFSVPDTNSNAAIKITGSGVVLDCSGASIDGRPPARMTHKTGPAQPSGIGIHVTGEAVVLRNCSLSGYQTAVLADGTATQLHRVTMCGNDNDLVNHDENLVVFGSTCQSVSGSPTRGTPACANTCPQPSPQPSPTPTPPPQIETKPQTGKHKVSKKTVALSSSRSKSAAEPGSATPAQAVCAISGRFTGVTKYAKVATAYSSDGRTQIATTEVVSDGSYALSGLTPGRYLVRGLSGGKLELVTNPVSATVDCRAGQTATANFVVRGVRD